MNEFGLDQFNKDKFYVDGYEGEELHILRNGVSFPFSSLFNLTKLGTFTSGSGTTTRTITRTIQFKTSLPSGGYENIVIAISPSTYIETLTITATAYTGTNTIPKIGNFCITAEVIDTITQGGTTTTTTIDKHDFIVYVHDYIAELWLGPETMTLFSPGKRYVSYDIMAKFDDGIIGDISSIMQLPLSSGELTWSLISSGTNAAPNGSTINATNGIITNPSFYVTNVTTGDNYPNCVKVVINTGSKYHSTSTSAVHEATGSIHVIKDPTKVEIVHGSYKDIANRMNIMIMSDGFLSTEYNRFKEYISQIQKQFTTSKATSPWNLLSSKINIWSCFIPSSEAMGTIKDEHIVLNQSGSSVITMRVDNYIAFCDKIIEELKNTVFSNTNNDILNSICALLPDISYLNTLLPLSTLPSVTTGNKLTTQDLKLSELIRLVGLPKPSEGSVDLTTKALEWRFVENSLIPGTGGAGPTFNPNKPPEFKIPSDISTQTTASGKSLTEFVFRLWRLLFNRMHYTPADTYWSVYTGKDYFVGQTIDISRSLLGSINEGRYKIAFNETIQFLKYKIPNTTQVLDIGKQFYDNFGGTLKLDSDNTIILSKIPPGDVKGMTIPVPSLGTRRIISVHDKGFFEIVGDIKTSGKIYKKSNVTPQSLGFGPISTSIHELCHNWLKDEYGNKRNIADSDRQTYLNSIFESQTRQFTTNLQTLQSLGAVFKDNIRWGKWPRIRAIAESSSMLTPVSGSSNYLFSIARINPRGSIAGDTFKENDVVLLRNGKGKLFFPEYNRFVIKKINYNSSPSKDIVSVELQYLGTGTPSYGQGALMLGLRGVNITSPLGPYQTLIHPDVLNLMTNTPLFSDSGNLGGNGPQIPNISSTVLTGLTNPRNKEKIVGLYENGYGHSQNVFHPSGFCIMRSTDAVAGDIGLPVGVSYTANYFCPVCRYILVDNIDPLFHPDIDNEYSIDYPY